MRCIAFHTQVNILHDTLITCPVRGVQLTSSHEAPGRDGDHCDVLGAVRRVEVSPALPHSIFRTRDGEHSGLIVGGRREGTPLLRLLLHLVKEHRILNLYAQILRGC
jgi:hypothetical protein